MDRKTILLATEVVYFIYRYSEVARGEDDRQPGLRQREERTSEVQQTQRLFRYAKET